MNTDRYPIDDDEAEKLDDGYLEYQLQNAFEDLCSHVGFNRATESVMRILREHMEMLKRQGRQQ